MISKILIIVAFLLFGFVLCCQKFDLIYEEPEKKRRLSVFLVFVSLFCIMTSNAIDIYAQTENLEKTEYKTEYKLEEIANDCYYGENIYGEYTVIIKDNRGFYDTVTYKKDIVSVVPFSATTDNKNNKQNDSEVKTNVVPTIAVVRDAYYNIESVTITVPDIKKIHTVKDIRLVLNDMVEDRMKEGYAVFMDGEMKNPETFRLQTIKLTGYELSENENIKEIYIRKNWTNY